MNLSYAKEFYNKVIKGKAAMNFTHHDIQAVTYASCPYSVYNNSLKPLLEKLGYTFTEKNEEFINHNGIKTRRKRYFIYLEDNNNG